FSSSSTSIRSRCSCNSSSNFSRNSASACSSSSGRDFSNSRATPLLPFQAVPEGFLKLIAEYIVGSFKATQLGACCALGQPAITKSPIITPPHRCAWHGLGDNAESLPESEPVRTFQK